MPANSSGFVGNIPEFYDNGLGPNIFEDYADLIAEACLSEPATSIVELAAGTGIVSRKLKDMSSGNTRLTVTDLNAPMLDVAKKKFAKDDDVEFVVANAMSLPFDASSFDLMVCQFGVMFFPDKPASFREAARVLKSGGRYVFNVWSAMDQNPFSRMAHEVSAGFFPDDPPGFYRVPFSYADLDQVRRDLAAAGWEDVEHETIRLQKRIVDPEAFATALVYGNPLFDEIQDRGGASPEEVAERMRAAMTETFGPSDFTMPLSSTTFICRRG